MSASSVKQTADTCARNHTSPSIAHQSRSVPARRNAQIQAISRAATPYRSPSSHAAPTATPPETREQRLIRLQAEAPRTAAATARAAALRSRMTSVVRQRVDVGPRPIDPCVAASTPARAARSCCMASGGAARPLPLRRMQRRPRRKRAGSARQICWPRCVRKRLRRLNVDGGSAPGTDSRSTRSARAPACLSRCALATARTGIQYLPNGAKTTSPVPVA